MADPKWQTIIKAVAHRKGVLKKASTQARHFQKRDFGGFSYPGASPSLGLVSRNLQNRDFGLSELGSS
jgi:hypothetical protein